MCESCGCGIAVTHPGETARDGAPLSHEILRPSAPRLEHVELLHDLLARNDRVARHNREHFDAHGVLAINLMSSPGAGKTTLLELTIRKLRDQYRIAVIEGDLATENDARRIRAQGVPAVQITTGNACHLDAHMLHGALHEIELAPLDIVFIENVGNLVCPASFDLGQHCNVVLLSVPEGDDKPEKYPVMFRAADLVLLTKTDLLQHIPEFDAQRARASLHSIANAAPLLELSSRAGTGIDAWCEWLHRQKAMHARPASPGAVAHSHPQLHDPAPGAGVPTRSAV
jgi:hydrogenase nickel incorporation protein HypB